MNGAMWLALVLGAIKHARFYYFSTQSRTIFNKIGHYDTRFIGLDNAITMKASTFSLYHIDASDLSIFLLRGFIFFKWYFTTLVYTRWVKVELPMLKSGITVLLGRSKIKNLTANEVKLKKLDVYKYMYNKFCDV